MRGAGIGEKIEMTTTDDDWIQYLKNITHRLFASPFVHSELNSTKAHTHWVSRTTRCWRGERERERERISLCEANVLRVELQHSLEAVGWYTLQVGASVRTHNCQEKGRSLAELVGWLPLLGLCVQQYVWFVRPIHNGPNKHVQE